tara:strand:+ start:2813 stop:5578 length:2766 start_codon:yes stop_codon:yes gene_type:complete
MSIFKETFKDFVFRQLKIRESIVEKGNDGSTRFGSPRENIVVKGKNEKIPIDQGAFYTNSISRQCVIRMSSGVDITSDHLLEVGENKNNISKQYILEGGILNEDKSPRDGFRTSNTNNNSYGDPSIRSNSNGDFGIVPMPGIIDTEIRTKTAYGSLREAQVNFVCHNRRQLEILELLYMRPGMPILLEWQWSPFINNDGKIDSRRYGIDNEWFDNALSISYFDKKIIELKQITGGNYDGFVGFCKNFEIISRNDGGFNCTTEIVAAGEVLEGLKSRNDGNSYLDEGEYIPLDNTQLIFEGLKDITETVDKNGNIRNKVIVEGGFEGALNPDSAGAIFIDKIVDYQKTSKKDLEKLIEDLGKNPGNYKTSVVGKKLYPDRNKNKEEYEKKKDIIQQVYDERTSALKLHIEESKVFQYYLFKGQKLGEKTSWYNRITGAEGKNLLSEHSYVRWDHLCNLFNLFSFPLYDPSDSKKTLCKLTYVDSETIELWNSFDYLKYVPYKFPKEAEKDLNTVLVRLETEDKFESVKVEDIINNSFNPNVCLFPQQYNNLLNENSNNNFLSGLDEPNCIGHIMLNIDYLSKLYNKMAYNSEGESINDFSMWDFINKIWQDVNDACGGHHNFMLQTELERPGRIRVIDLQVEPPPIVDINELFDFKVLGNRSIVRDFNINTTIPSSLTSTIAIASQAPTSIENLDQVTFANFTRGIKSRFTSNVELKEKSSSRVDFKKIYENDLKKYRDNIATLANFLVRITAGKYEFKDSKIDSNAVHKVLSIVKYLDKQIISLSIRHSFGDLKGKRKTFIPTKRSALIPLKVNLELDGISGIVIGNVFKIEKEKLPIGYQDEDIAFVVMGESQKITSGQDWTTELSGQFILLDLPTSKKEKLENKYSELEGASAPREILVDYNANSGTRASVPDASVIYD